MRNKNKYQILRLSLIISLIFFIAQFSIVIAQEEVNVDYYDLKIFDNDLTQIVSVNLLEDDFDGMTDLALLDLGNDTVNEAAVSFGYQENPVVKIFRFDGSLVNNFQPYGPGYEGRVNLAVADFDNDNLPEIVTGPGEGGGPHIRIFDSYGQVKFGKGFFAYDESYRSGTEVAAGNVNGGNDKEIVVSLLNEDKNLVKIFDQYGRQLYNTIEVTALEYDEPLKIFLYDLNEDGYDEIILGSSLGNKPVVYVYNYMGEKINEFLAYAEGFRGGFDVSAATLEGEPLIITSAGFSGGPHVRFFNLNGEVRLDPKFFVYEQGFRGGVNISARNNGHGYQIASLAQTTLPDRDLGSFGKVIKVDISEQMLYAYNHGRLDKSFYISSGRYGFDTPYGEFKVYRKTPLARMSWNYGPDNPNNYDLPNVPHILAFYGPYTIHGAYWHHNWGYRMSHGCVNVSLPNAKWIYEWTPLNTPVIVEP